MSFVPYTTQAVIFYDNVFTEGTLTASSETADGAAENAVDGFTFDAWEPNQSGFATLQVQLGAAASCDYLAIHAHTLSSVGGTIELQGSNNGSSWVSVAGPFSPTTNGPVVWQFTSASYSYWRIVMTATATLGVLQAGVATVLPFGKYVGERPPTLNRIVRKVSQVSEGGQFIGRSIIREGVEYTITQDYVTPEWVRSTWEPFIEHAERRPFFYAWRVDDYPAEIAYLWSIGDPEVNVATVTYYSVSLPCAGQVN